MSQSTEGPLAIGLDKLRFGSNEYGNIALASTTGYCDDLVKNNLARRLTSQGQTHRFRYSVDIGDGQTVLLAIKPFNSNKGHPHFAVEFNPNKLGATGLRELDNLLRSCLDDRHGKVLDAAFVTKLDYFADYGVPIDDIFIEMPRKETFGVWGFQFKGNFKLQTIYLGGGGADNQVRVYDTRDEAIHAAATAGRLGTIDELLDQNGKAIGSRMRIEARRFPKSVPLRDLHTLQNPFDRVSLSSIPRSAKEFNNPVGRLLLDAARHLGWQLALKRAEDTSVYRQYHRAFAKYRCTWWNPDDAAVDVASAVFRLGIFPEAAFDPKVATWARKRKAGATVRAFDRKAFELYRKEQQLEKRAAPKPKKHEAFKGLVNEDDDD